MIATVQSDYKVMHKNWGQLSECKLELDKMDKTLLVVENKKRIILPFTKDLRNLQEFICIKPVSYFKRRKIGTLTDLTMTFLLA